MGACLGTDVSNKYAAGGSPGHGTDSRASAQAEAAQAVALLDGSAAYSIWVNLSVSCQKLISLDTFSKSDPMGVLYAQEGGSWREVGRTEFVTNDHNPTFVKRFRVLYNFERVQEMKIFIVDVDQRQDPNTVDPKICDFLGEAEFRLSSVLTAQGKSLTLNLSKGKGSTVTLRGEEISDSREVFSFNVEGSGLKNVETFSKSDPFIEICRQSEGGHWEPVYKTEVVENNLNPVWKPIRMKATHLTNGEPRRPLKLRVYDFENSGRHRLLGEAETDTVRLQALSADKTPLPLTLNNKPSGSLLFSNFLIEVEPTFLDYFQAGIEMKFVVAIDFTGSNGPPNHPQSLHYLDPAGGYTAYESAIMGVGQVIEAYDSDRMFPTWGFGGHIPPHPVQHCFPIGNNGICAGVNGILLAYRQALHQWKLAGPTLFHHIVRATAAIAVQPTAHIKYLVLLILTDGAIMDMKETVEALVEASGLPMSILIVGVGNSPELHNMTVLDADNKALIDHRGRVAERDIVQFVQFNKFSNNGPALAAELLAELPGQFLKYMKTRQIPVPMPAPAPAGPPPPGAPQAP